MGGKMPQAEGRWGPTRAPSLGTETSKIYFCAKCNYPKIFIYYVFYLKGASNVFCHEFI
jgi:hypothetical protein